MCAVAPLAAPAMGLCMRSGEPRIRRQQRGATYLLLLFVLAAAGAGMAAMGEQWALVAQREREAELLFRGQQFSQALADWRDLSLPRPAVETGQKGQTGQTGQTVQLRSPPTLQALLVDDRVSPPRHHLRRLYADPFTGQPDWDLVLDAEGGIEGVASRSRRPALRRVGLGAGARLRSGADEDRPAVGDWVFVAAAQAAAVAPAAARSPRRP